MDKSAAESEEDIVKYPAYVKYKKDYEEREGAEGRETAFLSNYKSASMTNKARLYSEDPEFRLSNNFAFEREEIIEKQSDNDFPDELSR